MNAELHRMRADFRSHDHDRRRAQVTMSWSIIGVLLVLFLILALSVVDQRAEVFVTNKLVTVPGFGDQEYMLDLAGRGQIRVNETDWRLVYPGYRCTVSKLLWQDRWTVEICLNVPQE